MKPMNRCRRHLLVPLSVAVVWLQGFGGTGNGGEASEPVLWDSPAVPAELAAAKVPAAPEVSSPKRDLEAARTRAAELEKALAQEKKNRDKALDDLGSVWKQLNAGRAEAAQLRKKLEENERAAARSRDLEKQLEKKAAEERERNREREALRDEQARLQRQVADLEKRAAAVPALTEKVRQAQAATERLEQALAEAQRQARAAAQAGEQALGKQTALRQQAADAQQAAEIRAKSLEQANAKSAARAQELDKALVDLRARMAETERELAQSRETARKLQADVAALGTRTQGEAETTAAAQKKQRDELADLRRQLERQSTAAAALEKERGTCLQELDAVRAQLKETEREAEKQKTMAAEELRRQRDQLEEEGWIRQGKALREQLGPEDNAALVGSLNDVGLVMQAEGKLDQAEEMFRRALVVLDRTSGRSGATAGTILQHLADVCWARNDLDAAAANYEEAARQFSAALGDAHPRHAAALNGWARVRRDQQRPQEAEELYRMAIHVYERHQAKHPADLVVPLHNLALLLMEQGRLDEAGPLLERAVALAEKNRLGKGDAQVVLRSMTRYCQAVGDVERAAAFEERANELAMDVWAK